MRDWRNMRRLILIVSLASLCGCANNQPKQSPEEWQRNALSFLKPGSTREQVLMKLGEPTGRYENDRIFTYRIARKIPDEIQVIPRNTDIGAPSYAGVDYTLVLVFSGNSLQMHNLVPAR